MLDAPGRSVYHQLVNPWDSIISQEEQRAYRAAGFGDPSGIGKRPALLIIELSGAGDGNNPRAEFNPSEEP